MATVTLVGTPRNTKKHIFNVPSLYRAERGVCLFPMTRMLLDVASPRMRRILSKSSSSLPLRYRMSSSLSKCLKSRSKTKSSASLPVQDGQCSQDSEVAQKFGRGWSFPLVRSRHHKYPFRVSQIKVVCHHRYVFLNMNDWPTQGQIHTPGDFRGSVADDRRAEVQPCSLEAFGLIEACDIKLHFSIKLSDGVIEIAATATTAFVQQ